MRQLLIVGCLLAAASSYKIVSSRAFGMCYTRGVFNTTLIDTLNQASSLAEAKKDITEWAESQPSPIHKPNLKKAIEFVEQRWSKKKYIDFLCQKGLESNYLSNQEAIELRTIYWVTDYFTDNDYQLAAWSKFPAAASVNLIKIPSIRDKINEYQTQFAKEYPKDNKNIIKRIL